MSYDNAISVRAKMNIDYHKMLDIETDPRRIDAIKKQIALNEEEIKQLEQGRPLFGQAPTLKQEVKIIEPDPETKGQKVTIINEKESTEEVKEVPDENEVTTATGNNKKIKNILRDKIKQNLLEAEEDSLKNKIQEAKRTRAKFN